MTHPDISVRVVSQDGERIRLHVRLAERSDESTHEVTLARKLLATLAPDDAPEVFVRRCFTFLLERESKESILRRFDISEIGKYFPEFERTIVKR